MCTVVRPVATAHGNEFRSAQPSKKCSLKGISKFEMYMFDEKKNASKCANVSKCANNSRHYFVMVVPFPIAKNQ